MKCTVERIIELPDITFENVLCAYKGKPNSCMCGCSGEYYYTSHNREAASKDRGYKVEDNEVNDKRVKEIIAIISKRQPNIEVIDNHIFTTYCYGQQYTMYLLEP